MFTAQELRDAIERCNRQVVTMLANHEPAERIAAARRGIDKLHEWLAKAEREEGHAGL